MCRQRHSGVAVLALIVAEALLSGCQPQDLSNKAAAEGRGYLARPAAVQNLAGPKPAHPFQQVAADSFSRDLFEADDDGKLAVRVREWCVPAAKGPISSTLPSAALLEMRTDRGTLKIAGKPKEWKQGSMLMVPAKAQVELTNPTDRELIVRFYLVELR
jgi:hypothetical protein